MKKRSWWEKFKDRTGFRVYIDTDDWWLGYYRGDHSHFVCVLPTLVIRWYRQ